MERLVKFNQILDSKYTYQSGDYISVKVVSCSGIPDKILEKNRCRFILADGETHMAAAIFFNGKNDTNALNVCRKLQNRTTSYKLRNYRVREENKSRIFRNEPKEITLSSSTMDVEEVLDTDDTCPSSNTFQQPIPFQFTELNKIDNCSLDELVDIIGFTTEISKCPKALKNETVKPRIVTLGSNRAKIRSKAGFETDIALYGTLKKEKLCKHKVYALLNVKVGVWKQDNGISKKSLSTTYSTAIFEIKTLQDLPSHLHQESFIINLLKRTRTVSGRSGTSKNGNSQSEIVPSFSNLQNCFLNVSSTRTEPLVDSSIYASSTSENRNPTSSKPLQISNPPSSSGTRPLNTFNHNRQTQAPQLPTDSNQSTGIFNIPYECHSIFGTSSFNAPGTSNQNSDASLPPPVPETYSNSNPANSEEETLDVEESSIPSPKRCKVSQPNPSDPFPEYIYDFIENREPLEVDDQTELSKIFMDTTDNTYRMRSDKRGIALIINNYHFPDKEGDGETRDMREGSHLDVEYLMEILHIFKFTVVLQQNLSVNRLSSVLEKFKSKATENMDACFVAILTHGSHGFVDMVDGAVRLPNDIIHEFDATKFPVFAGKPKIFLIQACQQVSLDVDTIAQVKALIPDRDDLELENMIEIYSAVPGTFAARDFMLGSPLVYVFVDILAKHAHDTDLETMLEWVQSHLARNIKGEKLHCTWNKIRFNKKLFFNPGLSS